MKISLAQRNLYHRALFRFMGEALAGCWIILLLGFCGYVLHFNSGAVGFLCLLVVVTESILCGFWQATIVSILASICLDYFFYPPLLKLSVWDPQDWVALGTFEVSALVISRISSREKRSSREATMQRTAMAQLYELSRNTLLINLHQPPGPQLTKLIDRVFTVNAVAIYDGHVGSCDLSGDWSDTDLDLARECFVSRKEFEDLTTHTTTRLLWIGNNVVGAIAIRSGLDRLVTEALASLAAITLDRSISFSKECRIEAAHQSECLRTAVLDSLAHAVKTPLTAIQTAGSGLREVGPLNTPQRKLVSLIEEEASELNLLCNRLLQTAKLEVEEMTLTRDEITVANLVQDVLQEQSNLLAGHPVEVALSDPTLTVLGDSDLLAMALTQYLDNAAKYSFSGKAVKVEAWESHSEVLISVHNYGPSIPIAEREQIFQRFYRAEGSKNMAAGTGIGLSTVRMAADAHHGHAWVISHVDEGTTFFLALPKEEKSAK
jgi:two-component system sensor histidine kinase KdpD